MDITDTLADDNLLRVEVDNSANGRVYPQKADFTFYGGLYRGVNLLTVPAVHFELCRDGTPEIKVTPVVDLERHSAAATLDSGSGIYRPVWLHIGNRAHIRPDGVRIQTKSYAPSVLNVRTDATAGCDIAVTIWDGGREVWLNKAVFGLDRGPYIGVEPVTHSHENRLISAWRFSDAVHSWSWAGCEGRKAELIIYADAASVEVWLNGTSIGRKPAEGCQANFETVYQPGVLEAAAYDENGVEIGRDRLVTAGAETVLTVQASTESLTADGQGLCYLDISLTGRAGIVKASEDRPVTIAVEGAGAPAGFVSAAPFNEEPYTGSIHQTHYGRIQAVIRSGYAPGTVRVAISAPRCRTKTVELPVDIQL